jgi:hypothetical protein
MIFLLLIKKKHIALHVFFIIMSKKDLLVLTAISDRPLWEYGATVNG